YRLVMTRFTSDLKGVSLTDNYALFGFLAGALLPSLLSGFLLRPGTPMTAGSALFRLVLTALLVLAAPAFILLLWGAKCAVALVLGLALGVRPLTPSPSPQEQGEGSETASFTLIPSPSPSKGEGSQTSTLPSSSPSWSERKASGDALPSPLQGEGPGVRVEASAIVPLPPRTGGGARGGGHHSRIRRNCTHAKTAISRNRSQLIAAA